MSNKKYPLKYLQDVQINTRKKSVPNAPKLYDLRW